MGKALVLCRKQIKKQKPTPTVRQQVVTTSLKARSGRDRCPRIPDRFVVVSCDWQMGRVGRLRGLGSRCFAFLKEMWTQEQNDGAPARGGEGPRSSRCHLEVKGRNRRKRCCLEGTLSECHFHAAGLGWVPSPLWASFVKRDKCQAPKARVQ